MEINWYEHGVKAGRQVYKLPDENAANSSYMKSENS